MSRHVSRGRRASRPAISFREAAPVGGHEASGAATGTPAAEVERATQDGKRTILAAYKAAERSRISERSGAGCAVPAGTRWYGLELRTSSTPAEKQAFPAAMNTLAHSGYDATRLILKQTPTSNPARWDVAFFGTYDGAVECGLRPILTCSGVGADDGPTEAQCGLATR